MSYPLIISISEIFSSSIFVLLSIASISLVLIVVCFSISSFSLLNGCPDKYIPSISFSCDKSSFSENSSFSMNAYFMSSILFSKSSFVAPKSNIEN